MGLWKRIKQARENAADGGVALPDQEEGHDALLSYGARGIAASVAPEIFVVDREQVRVGDEYCRTLYVESLPQKVVDNWLWPLFRFQEPISISMHITPLDSRRMIDRLKHSLAKDEAQLSKAEDAGLVRNYAVVRRYEDNDAILSMLQNDITNLFQLSLLITVRAKSLKELDRITDALERRMTQAPTRRTFNRQQPAFLSSLPVLQNHIADPTSVNTLQTQGLQTIFPFNSSDISHETGALIGINLATQSNVIVNRFKQPSKSTVGKTVTNPGMAVFGTTGSGKSYFAKMEMLQWCYLGVPVIVIDPQNEYDRLCEGLGGQFISVAVDSDDKINPLDFSHAVSRRGNPLAHKLQFLTELIQVMLRAGRQDTPPLSDYQRSILDHALRHLYESFGYSVRDVVSQQRATPDAMPILSDLLSILKQMRKANKDPNFDIQILPLIMGLERYCGEGSLAGLFDHPTSVDLTSHFTVFNIQQLSDELLPIGMHLVLEFLRSCLFTAEKKASGAHRLLYVDEAQKLMAFPETAAFLEFVARTARKFGVGFTVMTQDPQVFLLNPDGSESKVGAGVLQNCSTTVLLRQHKNALDTIKRVFRLTDSEIAYLSNVKTGEGLIFVDDDRAWVSMREMASPLENEMMTTTRSEVAALNARRRAEEAEEAEAATAHQLAARQAGRIGSGTPPPALGPASDR